MGEGSEASIWFRLLVLITERKLNLFDCFLVGTVGGLVNAFGHWWLFLLLLPGFFLSVVMERAAGVTGPTP